MHPALIVSLGLLLATVLPAQAQTDPSPAVAALEAVVTARAERLNDATPLARCPLQAALGSAAADIGTSERLRGAVEPGTGDCDSQPAEPTASTRRVSVDSIALGDRTGRVHLTVQRGELVQTERHDLLRIGGTPRWEVDRITISGLARVYFPRPRPRLAPPPVAQPPRSGAPARS